jgi:hypothetical protein
MTISFQRRCRFANYLTELFARYLAVISFDAKPAYRETEVLLFSGDGWHRQSRIVKGSMTADCWMGLYAQTLGRNDSLPSCCFS